MQMNKNQIVMASIGGTALVAALVLGWLFWTEIEAADELSMEYDNQVQRCRNAAGPGEAAAKAALNDAARLVDWRTNALATVCARQAEPGELPNAAAFQQTMTDRRLAYSKLPEASAVKICAEDFGFGDYFKPFLDGAMPSAAELPRLQRRWGDVVAVVDVLLDCGAGPLESVAVETPEPKVEDVKPRGRRANAPKTTFTEAVERYRFKFKCAPAALVAVVDAIAADETRFFAIVDCTFAEDPDTLVAKVGEGGETKERAGRRGGRRGRRAAAEADEAAGEEAEKALQGLVAEPGARVLTVTLGVTTSIFGNNGEVAK